MLSDKNFYCISSRMENSGQLYGCFKIGPFYGHQSLTFANALRRTLLADQSRCIFEAVQIQGVEHEFSSLVGVRESVIDIILNLEKIVFQINKPITKPQIAIINFKGPGILRAQHIHLPANINCLVQSQYIATVEIDGQLRIKLFFTPNWYKFQQFLHRNILETEDKIFQKFKSPTSRFVSRLTKPAYYPIQKKSIKLNFLFNNKFSQLQKIFIPFKSYTFLRYFPLLKNQFPTKYRNDFYKNNKINFREIIDKANLKKKRKFQPIKPLRMYFKKNQTLSHVSRLSKPAYESAEQHAAACVPRAAPTTTLQQTQEIQENFLFIQTSACAVVKVHYTIQSDPISTAINERNNSQRFNGFQTNANKRTRRPIINFQKQLKHQLKFNKNNKNNNNNNKALKALLLSQKVPKNTNDFTQSKVILFNRPLNKLRANNEEFIMFEVWTDGSIHPQKAIGKAINEILLEFFPYSLYINKNDKINKISIKNNKKDLNILIFRSLNNQTLKIFNYSNVLSSNRQRKNLQSSSKNLQSSSKQNFYKKFLNLDIGNFYFDIETYIYLKEKKIYRIADFLSFVKNFNKSQSRKREEASKQHGSKPAYVCGTKVSRLSKPAYESAQQHAAALHVRHPITPITWEKNLNKFEKSHLFLSKSSFLNTTPQIQNTLLNFQRFIISCLYN